MTNTRRVLFRSAVIFAAWTASGLFTSMQTQLQLSMRGQTQPSWSLFGPAMIGAWIWALYTPIVARIARALRKLREGVSPAWAAWTKFFVAHLLVAAVLVVTDSYVWAHVRPLIDGVTPELSRVFAATLFFNVAAYLAVVSVTEAGDYAARWRERERAAAALALTAQTLQTQLDDARLRALEGQLQPHFLYNTLNMIAELVHDEPDVADDMLTNLGALLRRSCRESSHVVPLKEEISFVRAYAEILARRYRDRVILAVDVPEDLEHYLVPAFMLQPLVENAFRHGVERRESASFVGVSVSTRDNQLVIRVRDRSTAARGSDRSSVVDFPSEIESTEIAGVRSEGVGLRNIRERLQLLYGNRAVVTLVHANGETVAVLGLPLDTSMQAQSALVSDSQRLVLPINDAVGA